MKLTMQQTLAVILAATVCARLAVADDEADGRTAEQAGKLREAVTHYVAALQSASEGGSDEQRLREKIIALVQKLDPKPAVPEEAERRLGRGHAAVKVATDAEGFKRAANEFKEPRHSVVTPEGLRFEV